MVVVVVVGAVVVVVVVVVDFAGGARAWTRQAPWYLPCGEAVCIVCCDFAACVHASLTFFAQNRSIYICYILVPQKGTEIELVRKPKATRLIIKYRSTSALAIHSAAWQSSL